MMADNFGTKLLSLRTSLKLLIKGWDHYSRWVYTKEGALVASRTFENNITICNTRILLLENHFLCAAASGYQALVFCKYRGYLPTAKVIVNPKDPSDVEYQPVIWQHVEGKWINITPSELRSYPTLAEARFRAFLSTLNLLPDKVNNEKILDAFVKSGGQVS